MSSRDTVLARIRAAVGEPPEPAAVPRDYRQHGDYDPGAPELLALLAERLADYRATVHRVGPDELAATIARVLRERAATRVLVPPGLPSGWVADALVDHPALGPADLDDADAVVTGCAVAIAETGTLVLAGAPDQGRRAATLVPDVHVCVVRAEQVVHLVPEAVARLSPAAPLTFISGPSATSDIELDRVEGVHGPRTLDVVLVDPDLSG